MDTKVVLIDREKLGLEEWPAGTASDGNTARNEKLDALLAEAAQILLDGGLVAFPTETVYGLGANGLDDAAARKIYAAKGRPSDNPLILHISAATELKPLVRKVPETARKLMEAFWPGPLTMIFDKSDIVPYSTTGGLDTVAVRMPDDPVANRMIALAGVPVAAPSANLSGRPSPTTAQHVIEDMNGRIDMILDGGPVGIGVESTIIDVTGEIPMLLRPGAVTMEMLRDVVGEVAVDPAIAGPVAADVKPKAPGMKYRHYAPKAELVLVEATRPGGGEAAVSGGRASMTTAEQETAFSDSGAIEAASEEHEAAFSDSSAIEAVSAEHKAAASGIGVSEVVPAEHETAGSAVSDTVIDTINSLTRERLAEGHRVGILCTDETKDRYPAGIVRSVGLRASQAAVAHSLFAVLREFDELGVDFIYSESFARDHLGQAIMNRLTKAAGYHIIYCEDAGRKG